MQSHEVDYEIIGNNIQIVEVELDPGETVIAEAGGSRKCEGSILGAIGGLIDGDNY